MPSSARTALATPVWKWLRIGQPGVVSETMTSTTPFSCTSTERTMSSSTMLRRSSGSMTLSSALRMASFGGMPLIEAAFARHASRKLESARPQRRRHAVAGRAEEHERRASGGRAAEPERPQERRPAGLLPGLAGNLDRERARRRARLVEGGRAEVAALTLGGVAA